MTEDQEFELVERLAEEFSERFRRGEKPTIKEYVERYPELAEIIGATFQALAMMEDLAPESSFSAAYPGAKATVGAERLDYLGDYRIIREVGRGGMGIVYEAEQVSLGRHVAVKVLPQELLENSKHRARFEREAKAAAKLHHTNIVPVFGVGEEKGMGYYVMQFIQGLALDEVLDELKKMKLTSGSSGVPLTGRAVQARRRDISAADVARTLMEGSFGPSAEEAAGHPNGKRPLDETRVHEPLPVPAEQLPTAGPESGQIKSPSESTASARVSDTLPVPGASDVLSGSSSCTASRDRHLTYWQSVAYIGVQVAEALHYAHGQGILHRDIKPSNLLLDLRGTVWVTDFGLAKLEDDRGLTQTGDILGTLRYLAPETFRQQADERSEVYSLGLTLYEMLALRPAFEPTNRHALIDQVLGGQIEPLRKRNAAIPRDLALIVHKAVERDSRHRYQTAQELADDLRRFIEDEPIQARQLSAFEHAFRWSRHNKVLAASLATVATLVCLLAVLSTVAAGYFRYVSDRLSNTVLSLNATQRELHDKVDALNVATDEAQERAAENLELANVAQQNLRKAEAAEEEGRRLLYTTDMRLAPFVWKDQQSTGEQLRALLARHEPRGAGATREDLRGFEWYYFRYLLESSARVFRGHGVPAVAGALTSNGQLLTLDESAVLHRWDSETREEDEGRRVDLAKGQDVQLTVLAPDGRLAAVAMGGKLHLIDAATGEKVFHLDLGQASPRGVVFAGDSSLLVVLDDQVRWCDTRYGTTLAAVDKAFGRVESLALSADGRTLAVAGHGSLGTHLSAFRLDRMRKEVTQLATDVDLQQGTLEAAAVSADGSLVAASLKFSGAVVLLETSTGHVVAGKTLAHASPVVAMAFSPDGSQLATADVQGTIKTWGAVLKLDGKSEPKRIFKGHANAVTDVAFSSDGKQLVSIGRDKTVRIWDPRLESTSVRSLGSDAASIACFSPDGLLVAAAEGSRLRLYEAGTGTLMRELSSGDDGRLISVAFSPDGRLLAVGHAGGKDHSSISLWEVDTGVRLARLPGATELVGFPDYLDFASVTALAFSPDGNYLVAGFGSPIYSLQRFSSPVKVWDIREQRLIRRLQGHTGPCTSIDFSRDGMSFASGSQDGTAIVWSTKSWKAMRTLENPDPASSSNRRIVCDVAFSPDGTMLAMASREGSVVIWDVATGKSRATLKGHSSAVTAVAFSSDGRTLASSGADQTIRLWNVGTWRELVELQSVAHTVWVNKLAFSSDGSRLLASGSPCCIWSASPPVWDEPQRAAEILKQTLVSGGDFRSRIRMLSESPRLHEALALLVSDDSRVASALAATRANWHAARGRWSAAAEEFHRLEQLGSGSETEWLSTPSVLRVARALVETGECATAASLFGGLKRSGEDVAGDETDELLGAVGAAVDQRLAGDPRNTALLELAATIAEGRSDCEAQARYCTATIEALQAQPGNVATDAKRLFRLRGDAYLALKKWREAADDYARGPTPDTTSELSSNEAIAQAEMLLNEEIEPLVPTSDDEGVRWRFTTELPPEGWNQTDFDESLWQEGVAPFGQQFKTVRTAWSTGDIWLRRSFEVPASAKARIPFLRLNVDDAAEVFLNGQHLMTQESWTVQQYLLKVLPAISPDLVVPGKNTLAVHCRNVVVPACFIDVGLFCSAQNPPEWQKVAAARAITNPWAKLAAAYRLHGNQQAIDELVERCPRAAGVIGDFFASDSDWRRAIAIYSRGIALGASRPSRPDVASKPLTDDFESELLAKRAWAYEQLQHWEAAAADWARVVECRPTSADRLAEFAQRLGQNGQSALAASHYERLRQMYEEYLRTDAENDVAAEALAKSLLESQRIGEQWTVLKPVEMKSKLGTRFSVQPDGSLLTDGGTHAQETYQIKCGYRGQRIAALRLEALPHPTLRDSGPGWGLRGNFHLTELRATIGAGASAVPLRFRSATADYAGSSMGGARPNDGPMGAIDGNQQTQWDVWPDSGQPHRLILVLPEPVEVADDDAIVVELDFFDPQWPRAKLGCFRLSVANETDVCDRDAQLAATMTIRDPWMRLAAAYAWHGEAEKAISLGERALDNAKSVMAKGQVLEDAASQENLLSMLGQHRPDDPQVQLAWAKCLADRGVRRLERESTGRTIETARTSGKANLPVDAERDLVDAQAIFARLRTDYRQPAWTVLRPDKLISQGGATLKELDDASILASGHNPSKDVYEIEALLDEGPFTAVRLEALAHPSLPGGGPGRSGDGNVFLSEFELEVAATDEREAWQPVRIDSAWADREGTGFAIDRAIDGQDATGWTTTSGANRDGSAAIFLSQRPFGSPTGTRLRIRLRQESESWSHHQSGRFRLSATAATSVVESAVLDQSNRNIREALLALAKVYAQEGRTDDVVRAFAKALEMATDRDAKTTIVKAAASLEGMLERLAEIAPDDGQLAAELARHFAQQGRSQLADRARQKALELYGRQLKAKPPDSQIAREIAAELADFLVREVETSLSLRDCPWVWFSGDPPDPTAGARCFRGAIEIESGRTLGRARMILTADNNFTLYLNGKELTRGNGTAMGWKDVQTVTLTGYLNAGRNVVAVQAVNFSPDGPQARNPAGLIGRYEIVYTDGATVTGTIDETWKSSDRVVERWQDVDFDDSGWTNARKIASYGEGAWGTFHHGAKIVPRTADPWVRLAAAYRIVGDLQSSQELFERHPDVLLPVADSFAADGRYRWAIELYGRAIERESPTGRPDAELLTKRARAYEQLADWEAAASDWDLAAENSRQGANLLAEFARRLAEKGQSALAASLFERSRRLYENDLQGDPKNLIALQSLADLLLRGHDANEGWEILKPIEAKSQAGATLTQQDDGSMLSSGEKLFADTYTVAVTGDLAHVLALRLEALPYAELPAGGPGWQGGNFHLTELRAFLRRPGQEPMPLRFHLALSDYTRPDVGRGQGPEGVIDENQQTHWDVWPLVGKPHWLVAVLHEPIDLTGDDQIVFELDFRDANWSQARLGCFRLSATNRTEACQQATMLSDVGKIADPRLRLAAAYGLGGDTDRAAKRFIAALEETGSFEERRAVVEAANHCPGMLDALKLRSPNDPLVRLALAGHHLKRATGLLASRPVEAQVEFDQSREILARLRSEYTTEWTVSEPTKMVSAGGATLTVLADGSILAGGNNPDQDSYVISLRPGRSRVGAIRLETLPDDSFPNHNSGRSENGNFALTGITFHRRAVDGEAIAIRAAWVDHGDSYTGGAKDGADGILDDKDQTFWSVSPLQWQSHLAVFEFDEPVDFTDEELFVQIHFRSKAHRQHTIGRLRFSVTSEPNAIVVARLQAMQAELANAFAVVGR